MLLEANNKLSSAVTECTKRPRSNDLDSKSLSSPDPRLPWWRAWSNELREEMHQRRRNRRSPPGQVDKLPSSWSVTLAAASRV